jgi:hypothetical protein
VKKSPLYIKSGMGNPSNGSPINLGWALRGLQSLGKGWKTVVKGEAAFEAGDRLLKKGDDKNPFNQMTNEIIHGPNINVDKKSKLL